jgi:hypothetical protein
MMRLPGENPNEEVAQCQRNMDLHNPQQINDIYTAGRQGDG